MTTYIFSAAILVMLVSLSGALFSSRFAQQFLEARISYLVSFTAGVFMVSATALFVEALELLELLSVFILVGVGYGLAWGMHHVLPETHHHHDGSCHRSHGGAKRLLVGDAIHNVADGLVLVPAFLAGPALGIAVTTSIIVHEALQEISEFFVLKKAGYSTKRALFMNFLTSGTILIGVGISYILIDAERIHGIFLGLSAGFFAHVVLHDLLPTKRARAEEETLITHLVLVAVGVMVMASINGYLTHEHYGPEFEMSEHTK